MGEAKIMGKEFPESKFLKAELVQSPDFTAKFGKHQEGQRRMLEKALGASNSRVLFGRKEQPQLLTEVLQP